jgi:hypothetical protein
MPQPAVALTVQYLYVRQRNLGTIIIQTYCILQHESAVTALGRFCAWAMDIPTYFQIA